jgi:glycosyltransferase involved in cell wall biosynthesis
VTRILWLTPFSPGPADSGARLRVAALARGLTGRGHQVDVVDLGASGTGARRLQYALGHPMDEVRPDRVGRAILAGTDWREVAAVVVTQPYLGRLLELVPQHVPVVLDAHNVEGDLRADLAALRGPVGRAVLTVDARRLRRVEEATLGRATVTVAVSAADAQALRALSPTADVRVVPSGADGNLQPVSPSATSMDVVMVGHLAYGPNVDAVLWTARSIWPRVVERVPGARLVVVGRSPARAVRAALDPLPHAELVADPPEVRPYYTSAAVAFVPLRLGSGTRLKVLEALALGVPVVSTAKGVEGLELAPGSALVAEGAAGLAAALVEVLEDPALRGRLAAAGLAQARGPLSWERAVDALEAVIGELARTAQR